MPAVATAAPQGGRQGAVPLPQSTGEGLAVVLSPAQLAAVLERQTSEPGGTIGNRLIGGLRLIGCAAEGVGAGALLVTPEPTMLTKVGGGALALHAADQCVTGARQIWTGRDARSFTERGASGLARTLGASERAAANIGLAVDVLVPVGVAAIAGAVRASAVRAGRISLAAHEAQAGSRLGGHTILKHVGWSEAQLRQRLLQTAASRRPPPAISTFPSVASAERSITRVLQVNKAQIAAWAQGGARRELTLQLDLGQTVGQGVIRSSGQLTQMTKVRVVLRREAYNGMPYFILTSHPIP